MKFHAQDPQILGATIKQYDRPGDLVPWISATLIHGHYHD